jgi:hypothetical protein
MSSVAFMPSISWILLLVITNLLAIAACMIVFQFKARRQRRKLAMLNAAIRDYFRHSGVEVEVASTRLDKDAGFIAFVESEPMKRFRLSHIIEMALREHVAKTCKINLTKIYWRFPLKEMAASSAAAEKQPANAADSYINEGLVYYRDLPKGDVQEVSWEKFEESAALNPTIDPESTASSQSR